MDLSDYEVDFSTFDRDLVEEGLKRLLSQHLDKTVLKKFLAVYLEQCQELYDSIIDMMEQRTLYKASGSNVDTIGAIVGQDRSAWTYDESSWCFFDRSQQGMDQEPAWVTNAPMESYVAMTDSTLKEAIIVKVMKNHTIVGSVPELIYYLKELLSVDISFQKTGPNTVNIIAPSSLSLTQLKLLTRYVDSKNTEHSFSIPYPATLNFGELVFHAPNSFFVFDTDKGPDTALVGLNTTISNL